MARNKYIYGVIYTDQRTKTGRFRFLGRYEDFSGAHHLYVDLHYNKGMNNISIIRRIYGEWTEDYFEVDMFKDEMERKGKYDYYYREADRNRVKQ